MLQEVITLIKKELSNRKREQVNLSSDAAIELLAESLASRICGKFHLVPYTDKAGEQ